MIKMPEFCKIVECPNDDTVDFYKIINESVPSKVEEYEDYDCNKIVVRYYDDKYAYRTVTRPNGQHKTSTFHIFNEDGSEDLYNL